MDAISFIALALSIAIGIALVLTLQWVHRTIRRRKS